MPGINDPLIGRVINNKYAIIEFIGRGGMGVVYRARHESLNRDFAIKILRFDQRKDPVVMERFRREALAASRLKHPGVVYISDFDQLPDRRLYIVMEYIPGTSLREIIQKEGPLDLKRAMYLLAQIADALDYAHEQGIVHRDLKSENIFITKQRDREVTKILDFGLAKVLSNAVELQSITSEGQIYGTPETMAPEQIAAGKIDHRVDIYALGILTYELLAGTPPFTGPMLQILMAHKKEPVPHISDKLPNVPPEIDALIFKALQKDPEMRFNRAFEMQKIYKQIFEKLNSENQFEEISKKIKSSSKYRHFSSDELLNNEKLILHKFRNYLMELAEYVSDLNLGSPEIPHIREKLSNLNNELFKVKHEINHLKQQLEDDEEETRKISSKLRHAVISLNIELKNVENTNNFELINDLKYQLSELEKRLSDITSNHEHKSSVTKSKISELKRQFDSKIYEQNQIFDHLWELILDIKPHAEKSITLKTSFERLFELESRLKETTKL